MANFVIVVDSDPDRRNRFARAAKTVLPFLNGLDSGECGSQDFWAGWAAGKRAPVSSVKDEYTTTILWGDALRDANCPLTAAEVGAIWEPKSNNMPLPFDGFHAAVSYNSDTGITFGADLLGLFPVYYWSNEMVLIIASNAATICHHPLVEAAFNPRGLAGVLLTNGLVNGETLWNGICRLAPGHLLRWRPDSAPQVLLQYKPPAPGPETKESFPDQVRRIDAALDRAISHHLPGDQKCAILLSGGRDSRMLAGYLGRHGVEADALTLGVYTDFDFQCARRVARRQRFKHHRHEVPAGNYTRGAQLLAQADQLASGFTNIIDWVAFPNLADLPDRVVVGALGDAIVGGSYLDEAISPADKKISVSSCLEAMNRRALGPETLIRLLRKDVFGDAADATMIQLRKDYDGGIDEAYRDAFYLSLSHRERFHVGSMAWAASFWSWPVLPVVDRGVLEAVASVSYATLTQRRAQDAIIIGRFPGLAALPLDRNAYTTMPLVPGRRHKFAAHMQRLLGRPLNPVNPILERRYYHRIWNLNNAGWRTIRRAAEPAREQAYEYFNRSELDKLLPTPDEEIHSENINLTSGVKSILGFMLWLRDYA